MQVTFQQGAELRLVYGFAQIVIETQLEQAVGFVVEYVCSQCRHRSTIVGIALTHHLQQAGAVDIRHLYVEYDQVELTLLV